MESIDWAFAANDSPKVATAQLLAQSLLCSNVTPLMRTQKFVEFQLRLFQLSDIRSHSYSLSDPESSLECQYWQWLLLQ